MPKPNSTSGALCDRPQSFLSEVHRLVLADKRPTEVICRELGLPYSWFRQFKDGRIASPSVNRMQFIYEKLSGKKLFR